MKRFRIFNNGNEFGVIDIFPTSEKLPDNVEWKTFQTIPRNEICFYQCDGIGTLESIILKYETDGDRVNELSNRMKMLNGIYYVKNENIIKVLGAPDTWYQSELNKRIEMIEKKYQELSSEVVSLEDGEEKDTALMICGYIGNMIKNGEYQLIDDIYQCEEKLIMLEDIVNRNISQNL